MIKITNLKRRQQSEMRFRAAGIFAIGLSFCFLLLLLFTILGNGLSGFRQTKIKLEINFTGEELNSKNYNKLIQNSLSGLFPEATSNSEKRNLFTLVSAGSKFELQKYVEKHKSPAGKKETIWFPAQENVDIYFKKKSKDWKTRISPEKAEFVKALKEKKLIKKKFNSAFFTNGDSQESEMAGIGGAFIGSILLIISCLLVALPIGVLSAVYLEEFAPKNRITDIIEININNLAAVPSIVFGLLGLAVYLNFFGMPRSAPIVGGLTLALMIIPVVIISTRASLKSVPPSIKQAAMALGASPLQVAMHHTIPLAMPGIMTGTILGIARALGETAPLLMIGMVAFIVDIPNGFTDPASAMPVQIFLWSKNSQPGFVEKTAAAIIVLLAILILMNIIAVWIRKKYERRW